MLTTTSDELAKKTVESKRKNLPTWDKHLGD